MSDKPTELPSNQKGTPDRNTFDEIQHSDIDRRSVAYAVMRGRISAAASLVQMSLDTAERAWESHMNSPSDEAERYCKIEALHMGIVEAIKSLNLARVGCERLANLRTMPMDDSFFDSTNNRPVS